MIYLINSEVNHSLVKHKAKEILNNCEIVDEFSLVKLDALESSVFDIINECFNVSFLSSSKTVLVDNVFYFASKSPSNLSFKNDYDYFINELKKLPNDVNLILLVYDKKVDERSKLFKELKKLNFEYILLKQLKDNEWLNYVKSEINKTKLKITNDAIMTLASRTINDYYLLDNEIDKLIAYNDFIDLNVINNLVSEPLQDKIYLLSSSLVKGDISKSIAIYKDLLIQNKEPVLILIGLTNQFRTYYNVNYLNSIGYSNEDISKELLFFNPYRVIYSLKDSFSIRDSFSKLFEDIYNLDCSIKASKIDPNLGLFLFILNFKNNYIKN